MTMTAVVSGIATLGMPEATSECDCATNAEGSTAMNKAIRNFIRLSSRFGLISGKEYDRTLLPQKNLRFREALNEKGPRLHQHLLTIGVLQRLDPFPYRQGFPCQLGREGGQHATAPRRIRVAHA